MLTSACGLDSQSDAGRGAGAATPSGSPPGTEVDASLALPDAIAFEPAETLTLRPRETRELTLKTEPIGSYKVRFALLGDTPDMAPSDSALDQSEVDTDSSGVAHVLLTAPSAPTAFSVRASVGGIRDTRLTVSVSALGYTSLRVVPSYSGQRTVESWTATVRSGATCSELVGNPPPDGALGISAARTKPLIIDQVPIGPILAVTLRAGHYIGGCSSVDKLVEANDNKVLVFASDRSLALDKTQLDLSFGLAAPKSDWDSAMNGGVVDATSALVADHGNDVVLLLDGMRAAVASKDVAAFDAARSARVWDSALATAFGPGSRTRLRDPARRWMTAGLSSLEDRSAFSGRLSPIVSNLSDRVGARLDLLTVAGLPATEAGFSRTSLATWSADSNDTVLIGLEELSWIPSRLVTSLAAIPALAEFPSSNSAAAALVASVDCALVGRTLAGPAPNAEAYPGCAFDCVQALCVSSIQAAWQRARDGSGLSSATLDFTATAAAEVGDQAEAIALSGSWVGKAVTSSGSALAGGPLSAQASPP